MSSIMNIVNSKKDNIKTKTFPILPAGMHRHLTVIIIIYIITIITL